MLPRNTKLPRADIERLSARIDGLPREIPSPYRPHSDSAFLHRLPYELRLQIYEDLVDEKPVKLQYEGLGFKIEDSGIVGLALTCRQCRDEITPLFHKYATVQLDNISVIALRESRGLFDRNRIQQLVLTETALRAQTRMRNTTLVSGMLHCLEVFPKLTALHLVCKLSYSIFSFNSVLGLASAKEHVLEEAAQGRSSALTRQLHQNSWPLKLARQLREVLESRNDERYVRAGVEIPLTIGIFAPRRQEYTRPRHRYPTIQEGLIWGAAEIDINSMELYWKVDGHHRKVCDVQTGTRV